MATENQNQQNQNQNDNLNQNQNPNQNTNPEQNRSSQASPQNESLRSEKQDRGLEQNDHTYEGENDVTHAPKRTGEPQDESSSSGTFRGQSNASSQHAADKQSEQPKAGYAQGEHDKTPEQNPKSANASDPRESDEPQKGSL